MKPWMRPAFRVLAVVVLATVSAVVSVTAHASDHPASTGLVVVDQSALRAAPRDGAPLLVALWRGEALQLRGARGEWLQVWDPHRERGGFVRAGQVMPLDEGEAGLATLAAQLKLLRRQPGAEALGMGVAAAIADRADGSWLAAPAGADMLDALVVLQERLAARALAAPGGQQGTAAAHAEVARRYGWPLETVTRADGTQQLCPNPKPAALLRGHPAATASQRVRAALALTRGDCLHGELLPSQRTALLEQHAAWLEGIDATALPPVERNRLLLRRASVWASLAFGRREGDARQPTQAAFAAWNQVIAAELTEDDGPAQREAAIRLSPLRWLLQPPVQQRRVGRLDLSLERGDAGQTCLVWAGAAAAGGTARRCSHGLIHLASARATPDGQTVVLSVQPLDGWTELWRLDAAGGVEALPPAAQAPGLGAVEWAGWWSTGAGGTQMLVAREAEAGGRVLRRFEVYGTDWTQPLRWAGDADLLGAFQRGADAAWRAGSTLAR